MSTTLERPCPQCGNPADLSSDNAFRPFCSERCRLIDFGDWANEKAAIPGEPAPPENGYQ